MIPTLCVNAATAMSPLRCRRGDRTSLAARLRGAGQVGCRPQGTGFRLAYPGKEKGQARSGEVGGCPAPGLALPIAILGAARVVRKPLCPFPWPGKHPRRWRDVCTSSASDISVMTCAHRESVPALEQTGHTTPGVDRLQPLAR